jgi:predicted  nucleic acid-binding Zn-ribbon protein
MSSTDLDNLYRLHKVDAALTEIRQRAANFSVGAEESEAMKAYQPEWTKLKAAYETLHAEQTDLNLAQQTLQDKIKNIDALLYGGKVVNPREIDAYQKEIEIFKRQSSEMDSRLVELLDEVPKAHKRYEVATGKMRELKGKLDEAVAKAGDTRSQLETQFKQLASQRAQLAASVSAGLLKQYDSIRQRHGGIGMAEVHGNGVCQRCGNHLPEKTRLMIKDGRLATCESCKRILIFLESA